MWDLSAVGYNPKTAKDHGNVEQIVTKRGLKQFFHTNCYWGFDRGAKDLKDMGL